MSHPSRFKFVNDAQTDIEKKRRIEQLKTEFDRQSNFASFANAYVEDFGNPTADIEGCYPEYNPVERVRRIVENEKAKLDATDYAAKVNANIRRNRQRQHESKKAFEKPIAKCGQTVGK